MQIWRLPKRTLRQQGLLQLPGLSATPCGCEMEAVREGTGAARLATAARGVSSTMRVCMALAQLLAQANLQ